MASRVIFRNLVKMVSPAQLRRSHPRKIVLLAAIPLVLAAAAMALAVTHQGRQLAETEIAALESRLIEAKKDELRNYVALARTAFAADYGRALPDDDEAKRRVLQTLAAMSYGRDGYFFVFDYDGTNLVAPRRTDLINRNWIDLADSEGTPVTQTFIELARGGGGFHTHMWPRPTTGREARAISHVVGLPDWGWALGTSVFLDDVLQSVAAARADVERRVNRTLLWIGAVTLAAMILVFAWGLAVNLRERSLADAKLKRLTQRVIDTQEEERGRVARELHDSISQILVGARYALELARRRLAVGDARAADSLDKGIASISGAIGEVRRISRDLRPGLLDDLGLGPALHALTSDFAARTGIATEFETVVFRNRLDADARIALYRVAQEALTNIERHARAAHVKVKAYGHRNGATLRIEDDGIGFDQSDRGRGLGLRNMQERIDQLDGRLHIRSCDSGTVIEAEVPLSHLMPPDGAVPEKGETIGKGPA